MDYDKAAAYWKERDAAGTGSDREKAACEAKKFIEARKTCALATGSGKNVRCTPIEYTYRDGCFWLMSEGGEKFRNLKDNRNVCLAIFDPYNGFCDLGGMQITGEAEIVEPWTDEYLAFLSFKKIPEAALRVLDHPMYLIKVIPADIDFLWSGFKKMGLSSRQKVEL